MKKAFWAIVAGMMLLSTVALGQGAGSSSSPGGPAGASRGGPAGAGGGALGTSPLAPGTNASGTAAPSGGRGKPSSKSLGTGDPVTDQADRNLDRRIKGICKGC